MDFRTRRQLAVLGVIALVIGGIGFFIFRAGLLDPSCQDNRQNQGEEAVDCGGPCVSCALREQKPVEIFWTRFVQIRGNTYDVAAEIRNPNVKLAAVAFDYEFKLFDTAGVAVASRRGRAFLYPSETAHLIEIGLLSGRTIARASLGIGEVQWQLSDAVGPDVIAGSKEYGVEGDPGMLVSAVKAIVANRGITDVRDITVSALVFDQNGNLLGAHRTLVNELAAGLSKPMSFVWPSQFPTAPSSLMVEVRSPALLLKVQP